MPFPAKAELRFQSIKIASLRRSFQRLRKSSRAWNGICRMKFLRSFLNSLDDSNANLVEYLLTSPERFRRGFFLSFSEAIASVFCGAGILISPDFWKGR